MILNVVCARFEPSLRSSARGFGNRNYEWTAVCTTCASKESSTRAQSVWARKTQSYFFSLSEMPSKDKQSHGEDDPFFFTWRNSLKHERKELETRVFSLSRLCLRLISLAFFARLALWLSFALGARQQLTTLAIVKAIARKRSELTWSNKSTNSSQSSPGSEENSSESNLYNDWLARRLL